MKRLLNIIASLLGLLALGALLVALALSFGGQRQGPQPVSGVFQSPIETPTQPPYPPPQSPTPVPSPSATATLPPSRPPATPTRPPSPPPRTPTPRPYPPPGTPAPTPVPRCTFAARPAPEVPGPSLDAYAFSEPRVVLTHTSAIGIAGWLPGGQRLLITRLIPNQPREYVETFNVQTGELQQYGERHSVGAKPVWLTAERAVAFGDFSLADRQFMLRINRGEGAPVEEAATGLAAPYLAVGPNGRRVVFFTKAAKEQPQAFDASQAQRQAFPFTLPLMPWQDLPTLGQQIGPEPYRAAWHPDGNRIAFYNDTGFFLADPATGQICEVDLGPHVDGKRWAVDARWSPNGRYLATLTTVGDSARFIDLTLIDTSTGERRHLDLGHQYLYAIAWAHNSRDLLVVAELGADERGSLQGLYVVNATTGDSRQILVDHQFIGAGFWGAAWSPTGQAIALACPTIMLTEPTIAEGRLCIIAVEVSR